MKTVAGILMIVNGALFFFGGVQHAGVAIGRFHEPVIVPAAIVEAVCGICLLWGAFSLLSRSRSNWPFIANIVALGGVALGMVSLALGAGPRTASNDLYHRIMLILIGAALVILFLERRSSK